MAKRIIIMILGLLATGAIGYWWYASEREADGTLRLYGNVDIREVDLGFRVPGRLTVLHYEEGDRVRAGDRLAALDDEPYREALDVARARAAIADARLALFRSGSRPQEIERAVANVREASAALRNAEQELARQRGLAERGLTSQSSLDQAIAREDEAAARLRAAQEALALVRAGFRSEEIAAASAELELARAEVSRAETDLDDARLVAPADGTIITRVREPGAVLGVGEPVYMLSLDEPVFIRAYVDEPDLGRIAPGMTAWIETDGSSQRYRGQIGFISPRAEFTPKTVETQTARTDLVYRVRIIVAEADPGLRQGMPVTVTFAGEAERE